MLAGAAAAPPRASGHGERTDECLAVRGEHLLDGELGANALRQRDAEPGAKINVTRKPEENAAEGVRVPEGGEERSPIRTDRLTNSGDVGPCDRDSGSHGLEDGRSEALTKRAENRDVTRRDEPLNVVDLVEEPNRLVESEIKSERLRRVLHRIGVAREEKDGSATVALELVDDDPPRAKQRRVIFRAPEVGHHARDEVVVG
jgi:hypothetical protein